MIDQPKSSRSKFLKRAALLIFLILLPLVEHRNARFGYFEDDDLSTSTWGRTLQLDQCALNTLALKYPAAYRSPTGYFYYGLLLKTVGYRYTPWIVTLHAIDIVNLLLLWLILIRIGVGDLAAAVGCIFFSTSLAVFDAWWKPMFVYDVLATTFALASILAYLYRRWVLSFIALWIALRSKEIGISVAAMLFLLEMTIGEKKWARLLPYFVPAAIYGYTGWRFNHALNADHNYALKFEPRLFWQSVSFYFTQMFQVPYLWIAAIPALLLSRDRRVWFGLGAMLCGLSIYLLLPGRQFEIYSYLAMAGLAIAVAAMAAHRTQTAFAIGLLWAGWQFWRVQDHAALTLAEADERRDFAAKLGAVPLAAGYVYVNMPVSFHSWGPEAVICLAHGDKVPIYSLDDSRIPPATALRIATWDGKTRRLEWTDFVASKYAYVSPDTVPPAWQLMEGWGSGGGFPAVPQRAVFRLYRPASPATFAVTACGAAGTGLRTFRGGTELPELKFGDEGCQSFSVPPREDRPGVQTIDFLAWPDGAQVRLKEFGYR